MLSLQKKLNHISQMNTLKQKNLIPDEQLFLAISEDSEMAFQHIFERYYQPMWSFVMTLVKSSHIAEDIVQESFIKLWGCRNILAEVKKPSDFIFILVRNHALDIIRKLAREQKEKRKEQLWEDLKQQSIHSDYWLEMKQATEILKQIIDQLPAQQQKIMHLSRELGLSHQDIADQLKISKNTVKNHLVVALKTCREQLKKIGFSYFFVLPLVLSGPDFVFRANDEKQTDEKNKQTLGKTVAEV